MISRSAFVEDSMVALITVKGGCGKRTGFLLSRRNVGARFFFLQRKSIEGNLNAFEAAPKFFGEKSVESSLGYLCSFKDKSTWGFDFFFWQSYKQGLLLFACFSHERYWLPEPRFLFGISRIKYGCIVARHHLLYTWYLVYHMKDQQ